MPGRVKYRLRTAGLRHPERAVIMLSQRAIFSIHADLGEIRHFGQTPYGERRVIDISGNGVNNDGRDDAAARDDAVAAGVTVNGLPILDLVPELDRYYARAVIGGPRAFLVVARDIASFAEAVRRKLVIEIATNGASRRQGYDARAKGHA